MAAASALFFRLPTAAEAHAAGFEPEDYEPDTVEVWPENWPIFKGFERCRTQWRHGMGGPTGLDYGAVYPLIDRMHPRDSAEWELALEDIRDMEAAALDQIHAKH